ncbi:MAG: hypothetical protein HQK83_13095 [Fibrobacteria bacterium]|nr:hypothetical protein [Fibrobacteria bacterium]
MANFVRTAVRWIPRSSRGMTGMCLQLICVIMGLSIFLSCSTETPHSITHDTVLEMQLAEKASRVGLYLAAARQAESEGLNQAAIYLSEVAQEEMDQLSQIVLLRAEVKSTTAKTIKELIQLEKTAASVTYPRIISTATTFKDHELITLFEQLVKDEERHIGGLNGLLKK